MPFRVPFNYVALQVVPCDASDADLAEYVAWLETELETAKACQESRAARKEAETE